MTSVVERISNEDISGDETIVVRDYEGSYLYCSHKIDSSVNTQMVLDQARRPSFSACFIASLESTVYCGVLGGLFGTLFWWLELNLGTYCFTEWNKVPERIHHGRLIMDIIIITLAQFWVFSSIAPLCKWSTIKKLDLIYICILGAFIDALVHLLFFIFFAYDKKTWTFNIGCMIFLVTSMTVSYRFAQHCKASGDVHYNVFVLTLKLNLQFIIGLLASIPFNLAFLDLYYKSTPIVKTILACVLVIVFAIPKLCINHFISNLHGFCAPGDQIMLAVVYLTGTTVISRLMQAKTEKLSYFIAISVVHGFLNLIDKLSLPLRNKLMSWMCCSCQQEGNEELTSVNRSLFLANQTLISIITETTSVIFSSAAAYLILYYYKRKESTGERYDGYLLFQEMMMRCSIAVGIELIFNVIAVKIQTYLYKIPVIGVWKKKKTMIVIIHVVQLLFIVMYYSQFVNKILLKDCYKEANVTCFGLFKRV